MLKLLRLCALALPLCLPALAQVPTGGSSGGVGGLVSYPYTGTFTAATGFTVTAAAHGLGTGPFFIIAYDNSSPRALITLLTATVAANGDVVTTWSGSKTGTYTISNSLGAVGPAGAAGAAGATGATGAAGAGIAFGTTLPGTCTVGSSFYFKVDTVVLYGCPTLNTWAAISGSALTAGPTTALVISGGVIDINPAALCATSDVCVWTGSFDQSGAQKTTPVRVVTSDPGTCDATKREFIFNSTSNLLKSCNTTNVWSAIAGGSGLTDSGSNGILKRTALNTTAAATAGTDYSAPATTETTSGDRTLTGGLDASGATHTAPAKTGTSLPGSCIVGDQYVKTNTGVPGQSLYVCLTTNNWTVQGSNAPTNVTAAGTGIIWPLDFAPLNSTGFHTTQPVGRVIMLDFYPKVSMTIRKLFTMLSSTGLPNTTDAIAVGLYTVDSAGTAATLMNSGASQGRIAGIAGGYAPANITIPDTNVTAGLRYKIAYAVSSGTLDLITPLVSAWEGLAGGLAISQCGTAVGSGATISLPATCTVTSDTGGIYRMIWGMAP